MEPVVDRSKLSATVTLLARTCTIVGFIALRVSAFMECKVRKLTDDEILAIGKMTHPNEIPLQQRKCLNEAMRRRFEQPEGLLLFS